MAESVQPIIALTPAGRVDYSGLMDTTLDTPVGAGSIAGPQTWINNQWIKVQRNVTGDNIAGQYLALHNFIHSFLDPTHAGPPYIMRVTECISPSFGASVGRIFFGFGEFVDVTDATSLRGAGFYCDETGNWFALLADADGDIVRFDTTADTNQPRFLRMDIDGSLKKVSWYVDEVLRVTKTITTAIGQIASAATLPFNDVVIQSDAGNQIDAYIAAGIVAQMSIITNDATAPLSIAGPPTTPGSFTSPLSGGLYRTELAAAWGVSTDPDGNPVKYEGEYSSDGGVVWSSLFALKSGLSYVWDISGFAEGVQYKVRVRAHDGTEYSAAWRESDVFTISAPQCTA